MFESIGRSYRLAKESFNTLRQDPELIVFPVIAFVASVVVAGIMGGLGFATGGFGGEQGINGVGIVFAFLFYLGSYFVTIYFQVGLVTSIQHRLAGGDPNVWYGIRQANQRLSAIASWALIAAIVGLILRTLESLARNSENPIVATVGSIGTFIAGMAWSLATFFVIPIIAAEGVGGIEALKRSGGVIRRRWGEAVIGEAGITLIMFLVGLLAAGVPIALGIFTFGLAGGLGVALGLVFITLGIALGLVMIALGSAMQSTYSAVLYQYATTGQSGGTFSRDLLANTFHPRQPRGF